MVGGVTLGAALGLGLVAVAAVPLARSAPALAVTLSRPPIAARLAVAPIAMGEAAVGVPSLGVAIALGDEGAVPIASLTKLMTADVTLTALPLAGTQSGPSVTITPADVATYEDDLASDQSCIMVAVGEVLTERQLLEGLLVHSANNFAVLLAVLAEGSVEQMVAAMNAEAATLGLTMTHYADVSGVDPASVSDASDQLRLAELLMRDPVFSAIVAQPKVWLPVAGVVTTYTPGLGTQPGVVGIKSGVTSEAGGCDAMAYDRVVDGLTVMVIAVVLGQRPDDEPQLVAAGHQALVLATSVASRLRGWRLAAVRRTTGSLGWSSSEVAVAASSTVVVPTYPGVRVRAHVVAAAISPNGARAHQVVASIDVSSGAFHDSVLLVTTARLTRPSLWQRLR